MFQFIWSKIWSWHPSSPSTPLPPPLPPPPKKKRKGKSSKTKIILTSAYVVRIKLVKQDCIKQDCQIVSHVTIDYLQVLSEFSLSPQ